MSLSLEGEGGGKGRGGGGRGGGEGGREEGGGEERGGRRGMGNEVTQGVLSHLLGLVADL